MLSADQAELVTAAMAAYWSDLDLAAARQAARGTTDVGGRAAVTSGGHLDRVGDLFAEIAYRAGVPRDNVFHKGQGSPRDLTLPGYFRPNKMWDVVVRDRAGSPVAVIELKSQTRPSFGNNANNRAEEAIGNAVDLARVHGRPHRAPWCGYVFVIEDTERSRRASSKVPVHGEDPAFSGWTYQSRVRLLCERLRWEGLYDATWPVTTSRPPDFGWHELSDTETFERFTVEFSEAVRRARQ